MLFSLCKEEKPVAADRHIQSRRILRATRVKSVLTSNSSFSRVCRKKKVNTVGLHHVMRRNACIATVEICIRLSAVQANVSQLCGIGLAFLT